MVGMHMKLLRSPKKVELLLECQYEGQQFLPSDWVSRFRGLHLA